MYLVARIGLAEPEMADRRSSDEGDRSVVLRRLSRTSRKLTLSSTGIGRALTRSMRGVGNEIQRSSWSMCRCWVFATSQKAEKAPSQRTRSSPRHLSRRRLIGPHSSALSISVVFEGLEPLDQEVSIRN
jgi:hypothetical protein